ENYLGHAKVSFALLQSEEVDFAPAERDVYNTSLNIMTLPNSLLAKLNTLRRWVDPDEGISDQTSSVRPAEKFLLLAAAEIRRVLEAETFTPPGGCPIIPREF